jgi:hypothetical protein
LISLLNVGLSLNTFGVSFDFNAVAIALSLPFFVVMPFIPTLSGFVLTGLAAEVQASFQGYYIPSLAIFMFLSLFTSRAGSFRERAAYQLEHFHNESLGKLRDMLFDLVPPQYAVQLVAGCRYIEPCYGRAVVLQLDICNFTVCFPVLTRQQKDEYANHKCNRLKYGPVKHDAAET